MRTAIRVAAAAAVAGAAVATAASPAFASASSPAGASRAGHAVFVQTDNTAGNRVVAYDRAADGTLAPAGSYATGGRGGILAGSVVDHTASQGSLASDPRHGLLYAVNAGSDTISVFAVHGDRLALRQVLGSGGTFPVSVAVHGNLVYVLNALNGGSVQGYRVLGRFLVRIPGSHRALGLDPNATPQFTTTPGQVAFTPDGSQLVVTTKGNGNDIDVFGVGFGGLLSAKPTVNEQPGTVPFAISFDPNRVRGWLGELPARQREVVLLRDIEGMSSEEVCAVLALTEGNQRVLLHRGRAAQAAVRGRVPGGAMKLLRRRDLVCQQAVELVTDYLEGSLSRSARHRFEAHLAGCPHCTEYLAQMRETISLAGRLEPEDLTPQMREEFTDLYRRWRSEQQ